MFGVDGYLEAVVLEGASANDDLTPAYVGALVRSRRCRSGQWLFRCLRRSRGLPR